MPKPVKSTVAFDAEDQVLGFTVGELHSQLGVLIERLSIPEDGEVSVKLKFGSVTNHGSRIFSVSVTYNVEKLTVEEPRL